MWDPSKPQITTPGPIGGVLSMPPSPGSLRPPGSLTGYSIPAQPFNPDIGSYAGPIGGVLNPNFVPGPNFGPAANRFAVLPNGMPVLRAPNAGFGQAPYQNPQTMPQFISPPPVLPNHGIAKGNFAPQNTVPFATQEQAAKNLVDLQRAQQNAPTLQQALNQKFNLPAGSTWTPVQETAASPATAHNIGPVVNPQHIEDWIIQTGPHSYTNYGAVQENATAGHPNG